MIWETTLTVNLLVFLILNYISVMIFYMYGEHVGFKRAQDERKNMTDKEKKD